MANSSITMKSLLTAIKSIAADHLLPRFHSGGLVPIAKSQQEKEERRKAMRPNWHDWPFSHAPLPVGASPHKTSETYTLVKSRIANDHAILGKKVSRVWVDEFWPASKPVETPVAAYHHPQFPAAKVEIYELTEGASDPRNPTPKAGGRKFWEIRVDGKSHPGRHYTLPAAKMIAKSMHERFVAIAQAERDAAFEHLPNYGRF